MYLIDPNNSNLFYIYFKKTYLSELQHTINQPLSAVLNYINGCLYSLKKQKHSNQYTDIINALEQAGCETERIGKILKTFYLPSRPYSEQLHLQENNINDIITKLIHDLKPTLEKLNITVCLLLARNLESVTISEQYQDTLRWMMIGAMDLVTIGKSQLTLEIMTQQEQGNSIIKIIVDGQEIFSFSMSLRGGI